MTAYIIRRVLYVVPVVFGVAVLTFVLFHVVGGQTAPLVMLDKHASPEAIETLRKELGLHGPLFLNWQAARQTSSVRALLDSQLFRYFGEIVRFDFGRSWSTKQKISTLILDGIGPSLALAAPIFVIELVVAIAVALVAAYCRNTWLDRSLVVLAVMGMSVSYLVYILVGQYVLAYRMELFPIWGFETARYLALPVMIGVVSGLGHSVRFYRTVMLDEMYQDYVRTAFAKGLDERRVLFKHVLKNAMIPILTGVVLAIPFLYTGNLLLETFFGIPGLGYLSVEAINARDFPVIKAIVFVGSILYVFAALLTDICYAMVDPRIKLR
jgi:peptide/nickel transport system permease protein